MVKGRKFGLVEKAVLEVGAAMSLICGGCSDYGNMVARDLALLGTQQAVVSGVRNEIEGPRGTNVNANDEEGNVLVTKEDMVVTIPFNIPDAPKGQLRNFFTYKKWVDFDNNGKRQSGELFGVGECVTDEDELVVIYSPGYRLSGLGQPFSIIISVGGKSVIDDEDHIKYTFKVFSPSGVEVTVVTGELLSHATESLTVPNENVRYLIQEYGYGTYKAVMIVESDSPDVGNKTESIDFKLCAK